MSNGIYWDITADVVKLDESNYLNDDHMTFQVQISNWSNEMKHADCLNIYRGTWMISPSLKHC